MWILFPLMFLTGFVDSIAGGGGLISLSSLLAVGVPAHLALGTNKFSAFLGTGLAAFYFARKGYVKWRSALLAFLGALAGSAAGARLALLLNERILTWMLVVIIPLTALFILTHKEFGAVERESTPWRTAAYSVLVGLGCGAYDGFFGPGTGIFLILAFTFILGFNLLTACGNAKVVNFASNIAAAATFMSSGNVDYALGIPCALCVIFGNIVGARTAVKNGAKIVRPMMLFVITLLLAKIVWDMLH